MYKPKIYLSGGFRSNWQEKVITALGNSCTFFNPRAHQLESDKEYWVWDIHFVKECDVVFAYMEANNPSGFGLTFEIGLAYALNKTIILVDEKSNVDKDFGRYFKIVTNSTQILYSNLDEGINYLKKFTTLSDSIK